MVKIYYGYLQLGAVHAKYKTRRREESSDMGQLISNDVFSLSCAVLRPYKYAGYPMLIKTIQLETGDDDLFSKSAPILTAASEVPTPLPPLSLPFSLPRLKFPLHAITELLLSLYMAPSSTPLCAALILPHFFIISHS